MNPSADLARLNRFVVTRRWQWAKTYAEKAPHEYTVFDWEPGDTAGAEFLYFRGMLDLSPCTERYGRTLYGFFFLGGWKYWHTGPIINRKPEPGSELWQTAPWNGKRGGQQGEA